MAALSFLQYQQAALCWRTPQLHSTDRLVGHTHTNRASDASNIRFKSFRKHLLSLILSWLLIADYWLSSGIKEHHISLNPHSHFITVSLSNSQGSRCFLHFGSRRSNSSIYTHPQKCTKQPGETQIHLLTGAYAKTIFFSYPTEVLSFLSSRSDSPNCKHTCYIGFFWPDEIGPEMSKYL